MQNVITTDSEYYFDPESGCDKHRCRLVVRSPRMGRSVHSPRYRVGNCIYYGQRIEGEAYVCNTSRPPLKAQALKVMVQVAIEELGELPHRTGLLQVCQLIIDDLRDLT